MPKRAALTIAALLVSLAATACASPGTTLPPGASPSSTGDATSPSPAGIAHPVGAGEIVLRFDQGGGLVPIEFMAAHVPIFTLYGDGTVVFVRTAAPPMSQDPNGPSIGQPIRTARLSEGQVQGLLEFALSDGGLANARAQYDNPNVADAPSTVFEVHAAGDAKTVSIMALGLDVEPGPDSVVKAAFVKLAERLSDFDRGGSLASDPYAPRAYRGVLIDASGAQGVNVRPWPWPGIAPADFKLPADPNAFQQRTRVLTSEEAAAIAVTDFENGIQAGLWYRGPDSVVYSFVLRPLLPDETA